MKNYIIGKRKEHICSSTTSKRLTKYSINNIENNTELHISENQEEFWINNIFGCDLKILKDSEEGKILEDMIQKDTNRFTTFQKIKKWFLCIVSINDIENYIINITNYCIEKGERKKIKEIKQVLNIE